MIERQLTQRLPVDAQRLQPGQRLNIVVGAVEEQVLQIDEIAGDQQRYDLARALRSQFLTIGEAGHDERASSQVARPFADQIGRRFVGFRHDRQCENRPLRRFADRRARPQFTDQLIERTGVDHIELPLGRERKVSLDRQLPGCMVGDLSALTLIGLSLQHMLVQPRQSSASRAFSNGRCSGGMAG